MYYYNTTDERGGVFGAVFLALPPIYSKDLFGAIVRNVRNLLAAL